jgi:sulfotransferase family protein
MGLSLAPGQPALLFINGFHRSGTTVTASAVTEAVRGTTTTVGSLAQHIPALDAFLAGGAETADRGVDRLQVTAETAEEYGFLLSYRTGARALYGHPDGVPVLRAHIAELAANAPHATIVLKNPWDLGCEAQILADFPDARIIILRRRLADIERSVARALLRTRSSAYARALEPDDEGHERYQRQIRSPWRRALLLGAYRWALRRRVYQLADSVRRLPLERVAVLSYDELRVDPEGGARWAEHLVDPRALAQAFTKHAFAERGVPAPSSAVQRALDRRWMRAWEELHEAQMRAGIVVAASRSSRSSTSAMRRTPGIVRAGQRPAIAVEKLNDGDARA